ncbi:PPE domain-containing protein [Mycobacterium sp. SM1]|uniref:PPE family protein, SVP subgroup n=1 Tax=Mycobacterium sp. SM1 TaxID=2816243 RepID=UPI001BCEFE0E|nr:PPE domain-containing protein [Mycobacterium sp. SM1]MBS4729190.1 PPE domain-containing protein [Mycobacterium sp. SM1]
MDFAMLPPEINSGRMYSGPGSGPMLAAAEAWDGLAAELRSAASSYQTVISGLTAGPWQGPSSAAMAAAAASYVAWLNTTATQAEQTAAQARAAAAAYQEAFTSTVPPPVIAANRSQLARLTAKNLFGQYTAAIAATEAAYAEMWAQDAAAMYNYARSSASATALTPFAPPRRNTDPAASADQAAAVNRAAATSAGNAQSTVSSVQHALSAVPNALQAAAAPAAADPTPASLLNILDLLSDLVTIFLDIPADLVTFSVDIPAGAISVVSLPLDVVGAGTGLHTDEIVSGWAGEEPWPGTGEAPPTPFKAIITGPVAPSAPAPVPSLSAGLGEANTVGALSVPPTWQIATPAVRPVAVALPALPGLSAIPVAAVEEIVETGSGSTLGEIALAGMAGRAVAGAVGAGGGKDAGKAATDRRVAALPAGSGIAGAPAAADPDADAAKPRTVVTGVAAELREFAKLRDEGILTDEEYTEQKNRLLGR